MMERTTAAVAPTRTRMCYSHFPFTLPMSFSSFHPFRTFGRLQGPTPPWSFFISLSCSRKKSRGSTIPCSLQPCRLLEAEDSTPEENETRPRPFLAQPPPKIRIRQAPLPSKSSGGEAKASHHRASVVAYGYSISRAASHQFLGTH